MITSSISSLRDDRLGSERPISRQLEVLMITGNEMHMDRTPWIPYSKASRPKPVPPQCIETTSCGRLEYLETKSEKPQVESREIYACARRKARGPDVATGDILITRLKQQQVLVYEQYYAPKFWPARTKCYMGLELGLRY